MGKQKHNVQKPKGGGGGEKNDFSPLPRSLEQAILLSIQSGVRLIDVFNNRN